MRKNLLYILVIMATALGLTGCEDHLFHEDAHEDERPAGLRFSVTVPEAGAAMGTKSFSSEAITSLWVLVFDEQGFYVESQKAEPVNPDSFSTDENTEYEFNVNLQSSPSKRTIHLVANYDFATNPVSYGTEYSVMRSLTVTGNQDAYWQKVELPDGIKSQEELDAMSSTEFDEYHKNNGLTKIPLVRNFAKIHVESTAANFVLEGYSLWNIPDRGCVAPCVASVNDFAVYATSATTGTLPNNPWASRTYDELTASYNGTSKEGFIGYLPKDTQIIQTDASTLSFSSDDKYLYERPYSEDITNTAIIIKGRYNGNTSTYYKIDFVKTADAGMMDYYNIIRNFIYTATIISCTANGYDTPTEAAAAPASNNFVSSVVTQDIINISDGTSRLNISYTDTTVISSNNFTFRYQYIPNISSPSVINNDKITTYDKETGAPIASNGAVIKSYSTTDEDNWRVMNVTPQNPTDEEKTQTIIFYEPKDGTNVKIARTVTFHLRNPYTMDLECSPASVSTTIGQQLTINIKVPTGLASHLFPLEFKMESEANSLTPDVSKSEDKHQSGYMSTWYGTSITGSGKQTFGFSKRLTYAEYLSMESTADNSYKIIPCAFKTTKANSATTVWVYNKYFEFGSGLSTISFSN